MRTKYPKSILRFHTKAQQEQWDRYMVLAVACNPKRQRLIFTKQDKKTGLIHFDNFFVKFDAKGKPLHWAGYKFTIDREGIIRQDKTWKCAKKLDGTMILVKPTISSTAAQLTI